jgi:hypothetical protein
MGPSLWERLRAHDPNPNALASYDAVKQARHYSHLPTTTKQQQRILPQLFFVCVFVCVTSINREGVPVPVYPCIQTKRGGKMGDEILKRPRRSSNHRRYTVVERTLGSSG